MATTQENLTRIFSEQESEEIKKNLDEKSTAETVRAALKKNTEDITAESMAERGILYKKHKETALESEDSRAAVQKTSKKGTAIGAQRRSSGTGSSASRKSAASSRSNSSSPNRNTAQARNSKTAVGAPRKSAPAQSRSSSKAKGKKKNSNGQTRTTGQKLRTFFISLAIWILVIFLCITGFRYGYRIFYDVPVDAEDLSKIEVTITGDETDQEVGEMLLELGLIDDLDTFKIRAKLYDSDYVEGTYQLSKSYNTEKLLNILADFDYSEGKLTE